MMKQGLLILLTGMLAFASCQNNAKENTATKEMAASEKKGKKKKKNHAELMQEVMMDKKMNIKTVGILVYDGFFTLDAVGPMSVLSELMGAKVFFIGEKKGLVKNYQMQIQVDTTMAEVEELDILIVPGGYTDTYKMTRNQPVLDWIKKIDEKSQITASVCTGAWILGAAGLLEGKKATTHWYYKAKDILEGYGAEFQKKRYVHDGKYWSSAGVSAGMDMSLALIKEIRGDKYLQGVMLDLEYDPQPPIEAGTPEKSDEGVVDMMVQMYDMGIQPVIDSLAKPN